jgi:hypothetical protein
LHLRLECGADRIHEKDQPGGAQLPLLGHHLWVRRGSDGGQKGVRRGSEGRQVFFFFFSGV